MNGHTHVIKTTADKLSDELDSWLTRPDDRSAAVSTDYSCHHVGGRDWIIVLRHAPHDGQGGTPAPDVEVRAGNRRRPPRSEWSVDSTDAMVWADQFCAMVDEGHDATDRGWLVGWFANAMAAAERAERSRRDGEPAPIPTQAETAVLRIGSDPDHRRILDDHSTMPPDTAGWVEDSRRTWIMFVGLDGRPTALWLRRDIEGAVLGDAFIFRPDGLIDFRPGEQPDADRPTAPTPGD